MIKTKFVVASILAGFLTMAILFAGAICAAQDSKTPAVVPAPSSGKAMVCVYRTYRFTGSASHDDIFINGTHVGRLLNDEYEFMEVPPGTVVISGLPKMYYAGGVVVSSYTAIANATKKENERARFEAEAGKTYYFKWTAGAMETGIKVTPEDPEKGAKEIRKLHLSKPVEDKEETKAGTEGTATGEAGKKEESKQEAKQEAPKTEQPKPQN
ncbi:MAG TPA: DUF2846 domain-containing protein [Dongiaceae bacterium]|nr:DUF2846 domain-containing protein [Dongiaceae bacterium]